ncbi:sugar-binding transcriptional regulator, partial [Thioclava sp. BHET1]
DARTLGLELEALRHKRLAIGVVSGAEKQAVARAAVRAGYVSTLVTDSATAEALLTGQDA